MFTPLDYYENIRPNGPACAPEWRWLRASWLRTQRRRTALTSGDIGLRAASTFINRFSRLKNEFDYEDLYTDYPDETAAVAIWINPVSYEMTTPANQRPGWLKQRRQAALEAYLLTGVEKAAVAVKVGLTEASVNIYESWFFDFRSHLQQPDWMSTRAVRGDVSGDAGITFEHLLRLHGLVYGEVAVNDLLRGTNYSNETLNRLWREGQSHLIRKTVQLSRTVYHPGSVFEASSRGKEIDDRRELALAEIGSVTKTEKEVNWLEETHKALSDTYPWGMMDINAKVVAKAGPVELREAVRLGYEPDLSGIQEKAVEIKEEEVMLAD